MMGLHLSLWYVVSPTARSPMQLSSVRSSFQSKCFPSFFNLIIYLYFSSSIFIRPPLIDVSPFRAPFCICMKNYSINANFKFLFRKVFFFVSILSRLYLCYRRASKIARETCIDRIENCFLSSLRHPPHLWILQWTENKKTCMKRCMIECKYLCVYLWCELDAQCRVVGARQVLFFIIDLDRCRKERPGRMRWRGEAKCECIYIFQYLSLPENDTATDWTCIVSCVGRRKPSFFVSNFSSAQEIFLCNFYHRLTVFYVAVVATKSIIWLSFILSRIGGLEKLCTFLVLALAEWKIAILILLHLLGSVCRWRGLERLCKFLWWSLKVFYNRNRVHSSDDQSNAICTCLRS